MRKKVEVIPIKNAMAAQKSAPATVFPFEKFIANVNSVYTLCPNCKTWGVNTIQNKMCGDCNYPYGITYYSAQDVNHLIQKIKGISPNTYPLSDL